MAANLGKIKDCKRKLENYDINSFTNTDKSFLHFLKRIYVSRFRHVKDLDLSFDHPVSVLPERIKSVKQAYYY